MNFKTILACAALALVLFNGRLNAAVESDIVGYQTITVQPGFNLLALPFDSLTSNDGISIHELFSGEVSPGDTIQYWDGAKLQVLTYYNIGPYKGWYQKLGTPVEKQFYPGEGFWYNSSAKVATTLTVAGRVQEDSLTVTKNSFALIGSPTPKSIALADVKFDGIAQGATIQYWDGTKLQVLTYYNVGPYKGWYQKLGVPLEHTILPATGFWFMSGTTDVTITF